MKNGIGSAHSKLFACERGSASTRDASPNLVRVQLAASVALAKWNLLQIQVIDGDAELFGPFIVIYRFTAFQRHRSAIQRIKTLGGLVPCFVLRLRLRRAFDLVHACAHRDFRGPSPQINWYETSLFQSRERIFKGLMGADDCL